jgi:hypothetical protein
MWYNLKTSTDPELNYLIFEVFDRVWYSFSSHVSVDIARNGISKP